MEKQIRGPFVGGSTLQVADVKLFVVLTPLLKGAIDHISPDVFKPFPAILRQYEGDSLSAVGQAVVSSDPTSRGSNARCGLTGVVANPGAERARAEPPCRG